MEDIKPKDVISVEDVDPILKEVYQKPKKKVTYKDKRKFSKIRNAINRKKKRSTSE